MYHVSGYTSPDPTEPPFWNLWAHTVVIDLNSTAEWPAISVIFPREVNEAGWRDALSVRLTVQSQWLANRSGFVPNWIVREPCSATFHYQRCVGYCFSNAVASRTLVHASITVSRILHDDCTRVIRCRQRDIDPVTLPTVSVTTDSEPL